MNCHPSAPICPVEVEPPINSSHWQAIVLESRMRTLVVVPPASDPEMQSPTKLIVARGVWAVPLLCAVEYPLDALFSAGNRSIFCIVPTEPVASARPITWPPVGYVEAPQARNLPCAVGEMRT